ncbi:MAG: MFS transporter [Acidimicrobiales bacterium]|nr:MFS transporter [Acidimicrobiales bacterium]
MGFRSLAPYVWPIYGPWMAASLGMSILLVSLPIVLVVDGHGYALAALVAGAGGAGAAVFALPVGWATDRWGPAWVGLGSLVAMVVAASVMASTVRPLVLGAAHLVFGGSSLAVMLSRQADLTRRIPANLRGRAMSLMGGTMRFSVLLGTVIGGLLIDLAGARWTFLAAGVGAAIGIPAVLPGARTPGWEVAPIGVGGPGLVKMFRMNRRRLLHAGLFGMTAMTTREGRMILLPLIGVSMDLRPSTIGILVATGYAADLALFPLSGSIMDRFGRLAAMVPAYGLLAVGLLSLLVADSGSGVLVAGLVMGLGNGLSAGSLFTLSSDLAPSEGTASFLSGVSLLTDIGRVLGPLLVGVAATWWGLEAAAVVLATVMVAGLIWLVWLVGETGKAPTTLS